MIIIIIIIIIIILFLFYFVVVVVQQKGLVRFEMIPHSRFYFFSDSGIPNSMF